MELQVIDNCLSSGDYENIKNCMMATPENPSNYFPWFYSPIVVNNDDKDKGDAYFFHNIMDIMDQIPIRSTYFEQFLPIINLLDIKALVRIRAILYTQTSEHRLHGFHTDQKDWESNVAIFYLSTNNGWTEFENGKKVKSVGNRLIIFPNTLRHSSVTQTDESSRVVINFNYF